MVNSTHSNKYVTIIQGHRNSVCESVDKLGPEGVKQTRVRQRIIDEKESCLKAIDEIIKILSATDINDLDNLSFSFKQALICIEIYNTPLDMLLREIALDDRPYDRCINKLLRALGDTNREMAELLKKLQG